MIRTLSRYSVVCARGTSTRGTARLRWNSSKAGSLKTIIPEAAPLGADKTIENNIRTGTNRLAKTMAKFWEQVDIHQDPQTSNYEVQLDGKTLKTPLGFPLSLPSTKKELAYLISHEWSNLPDLHIKTTNLPLTSIAARSIDLNEVNKGGLHEDLVAKVGNLEDIQVNILRYLDTDTCLIFATTDEYMGKFRQKQDELYLPMIKEFEDFFTAYAKKNTKFLPDGETIKLKFLDCQIHGLGGNKQSLLTQNVVFHWLQQLPVHDLVALERAILTSKSFLCGASLLRSNVSDEKKQRELYQVNKSNVDEYYFKTIAEIIEMGNLEIIFQTEEWGEVEDTHDVDKEDWIRNLASAALLCH